MTGSLPERASSEPELRSDAARNRSRLLELAHEQLLLTGRLPSMTELARLAGMGVGTVYRHFPSSTVLRAQLGSESARTLVAAARAAADDPDPDAAFARVVGEVLRGQLTDPAVAAVLEAPDDECRPPGALAIELGTAVRDLLDRAREVGAVRPEVDATDIRRLLVGAAHALRSVAATDGHLVDRYLRVLLDGLRPPGRDR